MDKVNEKLGAWLLIKGNSKQKLARVLGVSRPTLDKKLSGESEWLWSQVCAIADLVNCTLEDLR